MRISPIIIFAVLVAIAAPLLSQGSAPFIVAETGEGFGRLSRAVEAIGNGRGTILIAPGRYRQCAVQERGRVTYRATAPGQVIFDGTICEQKAALVLRGESAVVDGLVFENLRVPDGNGAGIRIEQGDLLVTNALFRNSEQGILSATDPTGTIRIDQSTFSGLGRCDRGLSCAHSIYVGGYGRLEVTRSRFERGTGGHYVKSRAPSVLVAECSFDDTGGQGTNYMIDLPAGASGEITRNVFVQGEDKENWSAFVAVAAESRDNSSTGLSVHDNRASLAPGVRRSTHFVADWSGAALQIGSNQLGTGIARLDRR
jgi:hypothetical protein